MFLKWAALSKVKLNNLVNDYVCNMDNVVVLWYLALYFDHNLFLLSVVQGEDGSTSKTFYTLNQSIKQ